MRLSIKSALIIALVIGCKARSSSKVETYTIEEMGVVHVLGAENGVVKYRKCSKDEKKKVDTENIQDVDLRFCTQPDGFADVPVDRYRELLCESYSYDARRMDAEKLKFEAAKKQVGVWTNKAAEVQRRIDNFNKDDQGPSLDDLQKHLAVLKQNIADEEAEAGKAEAVLKAGKDAEVTCAKVMEFVLSQPKVKQIFPKSPEYEHLMVPFRIWKDSGNQGQGQQGQGQQGQGGGQDQGQEPKVETIPVQLRVTELNYENREFCNIPKLEKSAATQPDWHKYYTDEARSACKKRDPNYSTVSYTFAEAVFNGTFCVVTINAKCKK